MSRACRGHSSNPECLACIRLIRQIRFVANIEHIGRAFGAGVCEDVPALAVGCVLAGNQPDEPADAC